MTKAKTEWERKKWPFADCYGEVWTLKVGRGRIWLHPSDEYGTRYTSSFGPNSDNSFTGRVPAKDQEEAKQTVVADASRYWN